MSPETVVLEKLEVKAGEATGPVVVKDGSVRLRLKLAAATMAVFGLALMYVAIYGGQGETEKMLLTIGGVTVVLLSIMFYYLSPARFLRNDVCDAMCLTGVEFMHSTLSPFASGGKCAYVPSALSGDGRTLLRVSDGGVGGMLEAVGTQFCDPDTGKKDVFVVPPGNGLMEHARRLGATFTEEGLEDEIRDVLVNGFELAGGVKVRRGEDIISVEIRNVASATLCKTLRKKDPGICTLAGCPLCSFVACMVAEGTGRRAAVEGASGRGKTVRLELRLM